MPQKSAKKIGVTMPIEPLLLAQRPGVKNSTVVIGQGVVVLGGQFMDLNHATLRPPPTLAHPLNFRRHAVVVGEGVENPNDSLLGGFFSGRFGIGLPVLKLGQSGFPQLHRPKQI